MYKSTDKGLTWTKCPDVSFPPYSNFAQVAYFKKDGYIYMIGTQPGRNSCAKLARFLETDIENLENPDIKKFLNKKFFIILFKN